MTVEEPVFSRGDWIVHIFYGIGRVRRIEKKRLGGENTSYFRVEGKDSVFWVPVEQVEQSRVRPVASPYQLRKALKVLKKPPREVDLTHKQRQELIKKTRSDGSLLMICRLIRDLSAMQDAKSLGENDRRSLAFFKDLLLQEWSICADMTIEETRRRLQELLVGDEVAVS
jgi:RNA polymerase-interacting CarD/CdnL/TRCF family regulator